MKPLRLACLALWLATVAGRTADPLAAIAQSPIKGGLCVVLGAADAELARSAERQMTIPYYREMLAKAKAALAPEQK